MGQLGTISSRTARRYIRRGVRGHRAAGYWIWLNDRRYTPLDMATTQRAVLACQVWNRRRYSTDRYDCENFADSLKARFHEWCAENTPGPFGPLFGFISGRFGGGQHAINITLLDDGRIYLIEPQKQWSIWRPRRGTDRMIRKIDF